MIVSEKPIAHINVSSWIPESFKVSPNSTQVAYAVRVGDKQCVVVNGKEGKKYDGMFREGSIIFDATNSFHYLVGMGEGEDILVEERIEWHK